MLLSLREANTPNNGLKTFLKEHFLYIFKKHNIVVLTRMGEISLENMKYKNLTIFNVICSLGF